MYHSGNAVAHSSLVAPARETESRSGLEMISGIVSVIQVLAQSIISQVSLGPS
jgi:hypothetical protein